MHILAKSRLVMLVPDLLTIHSLLLVNSILNGFDVVEFCGLWEVRRQLFPDPFADLSTRLDADMIVYR